MQFAVMPLVLFSLSGQVDSDVDMQEPELIEQTSIENLPLQPVKESGENSTSKKISTSRISQRIADSLKQPEMLRKIGSSLALVIGVFLIFTILGRLAAPNRVATGADLVRVLGKVSVSSKHQLHVVQFHQKILLLGETQNGLECFEKFDDPNLISEMGAQPSANLKSLKSSEADRLLSLIKEQRSRLEGEEDNKPATRKSYVA